jgi:TatA/E family protein of Tat protein translocase
MLAFLDSPVQLIIAAVVILIVFGPQKLPEIAGQVGRALRELKRTTSDLQDSFNVDHTDHHRYDEHYNPPSYDSYGNPSPAIESHTSTVPEADVWQPAANSSNAHAALPAGEPLRGDFAASALADTGGDYGMGLSAPPVAHSGASAYTAPAAAAETVSAPHDVYPRPAEGSVPRQS